MKMEKYIINNNKIYERYSDGLFQGYVQVMPIIRQENPWLSYVGPKITIMLWREILAFFKWSQVTHNCETQVRLYFNKQESVWRAWAFPQKEQGMSTKEIEEREGEGREQAGFGRGWILGGTAHHHCKTSAFQSSTDRKDEECANGIHITVGNIDQDEHSLHGRVSFKQQFYDIEWTQWFDLPPGLDGLPQKFKSDVMAYFLKQSAKADDPFPEQWKTNLVKFQPAVVVYPRGGVGPVSSGCYSTLGLPWRPGGQEADNGKKPVLTKKERKMLRRLQQKDGGNIAALGFAVEETARLQKAAVATIQLVAASDTTVDRLFELAEENKPMNKEEENLVDQLEQIAIKNDVYLMDLYDWIATINSMETPTDGGL